MATMVVSGRDVWSNGGVYGTIDCYVSGPTLNTQHDGLLRPTWAGGFRKSGRVIRWTSHSAWTRLEDVPEPPALKPEPVEPVVPALDNSGDVPPALDGPPVLP